MRALRITRVGCLVVGLGLLWSGWAGASAAGTGWSIQASPNRMHPPNSVLVGVSCTSAGFCMAVGNSTNYSRYVALAERWDGSKWRIVKTPRLAGAADGALSAVSCVSARLCVAVGRQWTANNTARVTGLVERWNGKGWRVQHATSVGKGSVLEGVSCASVKTCTAVGAYSPARGLDLTLAERWNGRRWAIESTPNPMGASSSVLVGVSCTSASVCTAVGSSDESGTLAERWNGTKWAIQTTQNAPYPNSSELNAVSCPSRHACIAVGDSLSPAPSDAPLAETWNGKTWTIKRTPNPASSTHLDGVSCTSMSACSAVGTDSGPVAERWNGSTWKVEHTVSLQATGGLRGVSCTSRLTCTAAGDYEPFHPFADKTLIERRKLG